MILLQINPTSNDDLNLSTKVVMKLKTIQFLHGFQFSALHIIVNRLI
jgi:hypothetical protein